MNLDANFEAWRQEFYPIPADMVAPEDAAKHSLKKWQGLLPENLQRHGLTGIKFFCFNAETCALCVHHLKPPAGSSKTKHCETCPIFTLKHRSCGPEYGRWFVVKDPEPMIRLLQEVVDAQAKGAVGANQS